jgi:hypothetical protein
MESIIVDANKVFATFITEGVVHDLLFSRLEYAGKLSEGLKLAPHPKDFPIWSNEKAFKKQSKVKVFSTSDLISLLSQTRP